MNPPTLLLLISVVCLSGCISRRSGGFEHGTPTDTSPVRRVDYSRSPEMKAVAEHCRRFANQMYPQIVALLGDDGSKSRRQFDIVFAKRLRDDTAGVLAQTRGSTIYISVYALEQNPYVFSTNLDWHTPNANNREAVMTQTLDGILVHEMAHVAQRLHWFSLFNRSKVPPWWVEGLAYYVGGKLGYTNSLNCPKCLWWQDYFSDGWCAAAFLLHLEATYGSDLIRQLQSQIRRRSYPDRFFDATTGKNLKELWAEFKKTPAFIAADAAVLELEQSLGYVDHRPPKGIDPQSAARVEAARSRACLKRQSGGALTVAALEFLETLRKQGQLPGWTPHDEGNSVLPPFAVRVETDPVSRTIRRQKDGDRSVYHYLVVQESKSNGWKLKRAWRTDKDGQTIAEYALP